MAAIAPPDGIAAMAAPPARTVDQRGPDVRSPRTSIAGSGLIGMRSYLRPLGAVSVTCRAPPSSRPRYRAGRESPLSAAGACLARARFLGPFSGGVGGSHQ